MDTISKCPYCGKPYQNKEVQICGHTKSFLVATCNCAEIKEKEEQERREKEAQAAKLKKIFENSLMTPLFKDNTFERLSAYAEKFGNKEELEYCEKYANNFNPDVSKGIFMVGRYGVGKTAILAAVCNELMINGHTCLFTTLSALLDKFSSYSFNNSGDITGLLMWLIKFDFIVLDDIGREAYTDKRQEIVFRIIDTLMNYKKAVAFTANPEMIVRLKKMREWGAILDRLKYLCPTKIDFNGESVREQACTL